MHSKEFNILNMKFLKINICIIELICIESVNDINYYAGQFLELLYPGSNQNMRHVPITIASPPHEFPKIELHISYKYKSFSKELIKYLQYCFKSKKTIRAIFPLGSCHVGLTPINMPIVFFVRGTGFSQAKSIIEHFLYTGIKHHLYLFREVENISDAYCSDKVEYWIKNQKLITTSLLVKDKNIESTAQVEKIFNEMSDQLNIFNDKLYFLTGSYKSILEIYRGLMSRGVSKNNIKSDLLNPINRMENQI